MPDRTRKLIADFLINRQIENLICDSFYLADDLKKYIYEFVQLDTTTVELHETLKRVWRNRVLAGAGRLRLPSPVSRPSDPRTLGDASGDGARP